MAETITLKAETRDRAGKGAARSARRSGFVPGVIYGDSKPPILINLDAITLGNLMRDPAFQTHLFDVELAGDRHRVLARDVQLDPVSDKPLHVDFLRVSERSTITVDIPVHFINEALSPGLKRGGVLNVVRHEVEMICQATSIPDNLTIDLTGAEIGDSLRMSKVALPEGVRPSVSRDFVIATIAAPSAVRAEAAEAATAGEEAPAAEPAKS